MHGLVSAERENLDRPEKGFHLGKLSPWLIGQMCTQYQFTYSNG